MSEAKAKSITGLDAKTGFMMAGAISRDKAAPPDKPNARCNKCGGDLRATPSILAVIKLGACDHKDCGGQFVELTDV